MKTIKIKTYVSLLCAAVLSQYDARAQLSFSTQLRTRTEYRDGQGAPLPNGAKPALFTSQRSRLGATFSGYRLKLNLTMQDVRVWGQDASTINRTTTADNNGLLLHEAWAEIGLSDTINKRSHLSLKIGRQELVYDAQRLVGNLDWLQQARRHDAIVAQFTSAGWTLHTGLAFNQNKENASGTKYNPSPAGNNAASTNSGSMYKSLAYAYVSKKYKQGGTSFLFFTDHFTKYHTAIENNLPVKVWDDGVWSRFTTGLYTSNTIGNTSLNGEAYYQFGKTAAGQNLSAGLLSVSVMQSLHKTFAAGAGIDYTSGGGTTGKSNAFDPLYGTPHKFWGLMDYFYAGSPFGNRGLADYYIKTRYLPGTRLQLTADLHRFSATSDVSDGAGNTMRRSFGTEIDIVASYTLTKTIAFEAGYSHFFSSPSLAAAGAKNIANAQSNNNWAYLMIRVQSLYQLK